MWAYVLSLLLLKKFGLPRPLRYAILIFLFGLLIVVVIYTANLFLTPQRKGQCSPCPHT